jgi:hypothetical protein
VNLSPACSERTGWLTEMLDGMSDSLLPILLNPKSRKETPLYTASLELQGAITANTPDWVYLLQTEHTGEEIQQTAVSLEVVGTKAHLRTERRIDRIYLIDHANQFIQRHVRGFLVRCRVWHARRGVAVLVIQFTVRMWLAKVKLWRRRREVAS